MCKDNRKWFFYYDYSSLLTNIGRGLYLTLNHIKMKASRNTITVRSTCFHHLNDKIYLIGLFLFLSNIPSFYGFLLFLSYVYLAFKNHCM